MLANNSFSEGDGVLIRFRLFADQLAHGWGWAIDNLQIQPSITGVEEPVANDLQIYPVPAREKLFLDMLNPRSAPVTVEIADAVGKAVFTQSLAGNDGAIHLAIDLQSLKDGLYILRATSDRKVYVRKFLRIRE